MHEMYVVQRKNNLRECSFSTADPFFSEEVCVKFTDTQIIFTHPTIDYQGRTFKFYFRGTRYTNGFVCTFPSGYYTPHEDSDEDHYIIDIKDRINDKGTGVRHPQRAEGVCV